MESIHARIKRLREAKGLTQEALGKAAKVSYQSVQEWEREGGTAPNRRRQPLVAGALGISVQELMSGVVFAGSSTASAVAAGPEVARDGKEEMLLELYRRLLPAQRKELFDVLWSHVDANNVSSRLMGNKDLRQVDDDRIKQKYGLPKHGPKKPPPKRRSQKPKGKAATKPEPRRPDRAQDDND